MGQNKCKGFGPEGLDRGKHSLGGKSGSPWMPGGNLCFSNTLHPGRDGLGDRLDRAGTVGLLARPDLGGKEHGGVQGGMPGGHKAMVAP